MFEQSPVELSFNRVGGDDHQLSRYQRTWWQNLFYYRFFLSACFQHLLLYHREDDPPIKLHGAQRICFTNVDQLHRPLKQ